MSERSRVLGVDPGFANFGWCVLEFPPAHGGSLVCLKAGVLRTQKSTIKTNTHAAHDNVRRAQEISRTLFDLVEGFSIRAICAESMSFPRNASVAAKMAMSWGIIAALSEYYQIPVISSTPQQVKLAAAKSKSASKEEVAAGVRGVVSGIVIEVSHVPASLREHPYDAAASVIAAEHSDVLRAIRRAA